MDFYKKILPSVMGGIIILKILAQWGHSTHGGRGGGEYFICKNCYEDINRKHETSLFGDFGWKDVF